MDCDFPSTSILYHVTVRKLKDPLLFNIKIFCAICDEDVHY